MKHLLKPVILLLLATTASVAQSPSEVPQNGMELLKRTSKHYADAKSYHIEAVEEGTYSNDMERGWSKSVLNAAEDKAGQFHFEGRTGWGGALQISDGTTMWQYRPDGRIYTKIPAASYDPKKAFYVGPEIQLPNARNLRATLAIFSDHYKSAARLPDATIEVGGRSVDCYVIRLQHSDQKRGTDASYEETVWIDHTNNVYVKRESHEKASINTMTGIVWRNQQTTTTYPVTDLDASLPASLFTFVPPTDAKLVDAFPNPFEHMSGGPSMEGQTIPDLKLASGDGKTLSMASLRGKVVVLDIWATWCAPCVKGLDSLATLYKGGKDKGLALITIDEDEDAATATAMLTKKGFDWMNVHDDGTIADSIGGLGGIPRTILVDQHGKVVYDRDFSEVDLRKAIAGLGPEFASFAPKEEKLAPCGTQISAQTDPQTNPKTNPQPNQ